MAVNKVTEDVRGQHVKSEERSGVRWHEVTQWLLYHRRHT